MDRNAYPDCRGHRFFDQVNFPDTCHGGRIYNRFLLHLGNTSRNTYHHPRFDEAVVFEYFLDEVFDHGIGDFKIGDHPILHRSNGFQFIVGPAVHLFGFQAHCYRISVPMTIITGDRYNRRFVQDNSLVLDIDQRVGGAQIHGHIGYEIIGKVLEKIPNHGRSLRSEWFCPRRFQSIFLNCCHRRERKRTRIRIPISSGYLPC